MFDAMISRDDQGAHDFAKITATAPAKLYGLQQKGALVEGMDADIVIWDPDKKVTYGANDLKDNVGYNPWEGRTVTGWPEQVILRGNPLMKDGQFFGVAGGGNWIDRPELATKPFGSSRQRGRT
jgi:dihydropyrimidinase